MRQPLRAPSQPPFTIRPLQTTSGLVQGYWCKALVTKCEVMKCTVMACKMRSTAFHVFLFNIMSRHTVLCRTMRTHPRYVQPVECTHVTLCCVAEKLNMTFRGMCFRRKVPTTSKHVKFSLHVIMSPLHFFTSFSFICFIKMFGFSSYLSVCSTYTTCFSRCLLECHKMCSVCSQALRRNQRN